MPSKSNCSDVEAQVYEEVTNDAHTHKERSVRGRLLSILKRCIRCCGYLAIMQALHKNSANSRNTIFPMSLNPGETGSAPELTENPPTIRGYPSLAAFMTSHPDFLIYRSFDGLRNQLLLLKQAELSTLEQRLENLNRQDSSNASSPQARSLANHIAYRNARKRLLSTIQSKLKDYDSLVLSQHTTSTFEKASKCNIESYTRWLKDNQPVLPSDMVFANKQQELVSLISHENFMSSIFDKILNKLMAYRIIGKFFKDELSYRSDDPYVQLFSPRKILAFERVLVASIGVLALAAPIIILSCIRVGLFRILALLLSIWVFSVLLVLFTRAKGHGILVAIAGYAAVVAVFAGNLGN